jgi:uncharacterized membrane protein YhaH (DUF805 family)
MRFMFLPLLRYAQFSGRARRMEFWIWKLLVTTVTLVFMIGFVRQMIDAESMGITQPSFGAPDSFDTLTISYCVYYLLTFIPDLAVTVRRLHDIERSGWWVLVPLVPNLLMIANALAFPLPADAPIAPLEVALSLATLVTGLLLVVFLFFRGTDGPNLYGPDPKGGGGIEDTFS